jgi:hypothetical protein
VCRGTKDSGAEEVVVEGGFVFSERCTIPRTALEGEGAGFQQQTVEKEGVGSRMSQAEGAKELRRAVT